MDETLKKILIELQTLNVRVEKIEQQVGGMGQKFSGLEEKFSGLDQKFSGLDQKFSGLEEKVDRMEVRLNSVFEQTAGLLEFKTETSQKLEDLIEKMACIYELLGEHDIAIKRLRRKIAMS
ncbi:MAG: hypothetical protein CVU88_01345 [Firmicutes bacterium HGW-Firmicutes-13]|nr:MAG: hypothetical protein CVU88_01345 [Firmicutes bacterium HGW-Firmicutes-13]